MDKKVLLLLISRAMQYENI